jgi:hypothetical protein
MKIQRILLVLLVAKTFVLAQLNIYPWTIGSDIASDKYQIRVREINGGNVGSWQDPGVMLSKPRNYLVDKLGYAASEFSGNDHNRVGGTAVTSFLEDRTMSFSIFEYSGTIEVEVTKVHGTVAQRVQVAPKALGVDPHYFDGRVVRFRIHSNDTMPSYFSVDFVSTDNRDDDRYSGKDIKHSVMIFAEKLESQAGYPIPTPTSPGVVVWNSNTNLATLRNADIIYFPAGNHDLKAHKDNDNSWYYQVSQYDNAPLYRGRLFLGKDGQKVYLAPGAYVRGGFHSNGKKNNWLYGRGIISGRSHLMHELIRPVNGANGLSYVQTTQSKQALVYFGDGAVYNGVMFKDAWHHTCPSGKNTTIRNIKIVGWSSNNDGIRPASGSTADGMFIKTSDDYDYARDPHTVTNSIFWPGVNGAIGQLGWNNLGSGYAEYRNIFVINSEWSSTDKNNVGFINGSVADAGIKLQGNVIRDITLEGTVNYLVNAEIEQGSGIGYLKDFSFTNISVEKPFQNTNGTLVKQRMAGLSNTWLENWTFTNLFVAGVLVSQQNYGNWFNLNLDAQGNDNAKMVRNVQFRSVGVIYTISVTQNAGGTITPVGNSGIIQVAAGMPQTITITPSAGKRIVRVVHNGVDLGRRQNIVINNMQSNHTLSVEFADGSDYYELGNSSSSSSTQISSSSSSEALSSSSSLPSSSSQITSSSSSAIVLIPDDINDLSIMSVECNSVQLSWSDVENESGYRIRRKTVEESAYTNLTDVIANTISWLDETVLENTTYVYMVRPIQAGVAVSISNTAQITTSQCGPVANFKSMTPERIQKEDRSWGYNLNGQKVVPKKRKWSGPLY